MNNTTRSSWQLDSEGRIWARGILVAKVVSTLADARLLVAAPMLYHTLEMVKSKLCAEAGYEGATGLCAHFNDKEWDQLIDALAAAETEAPDD